MKKILICLTLLFYAIIPTFADEGMWLIQNINSALEKNMKERGLKLRANEIYDANAKGATVSDAIVSLGFYCSASIISDEGLLITNHHCAYSDIFALSTEEHNYMKDGFWAMNRSQEIPIDGKEIFFLKKVLDLTDEVNATIDELKKQNKPCGMRRVSSILEKKYAKETNMEAFLSSMWAGEKYYMSLYEKYTDLRLVAAPPVAMASFGGDVDNWEWPQQKCDFAMYRVYTGKNGENAQYSPDNIPLHNIKKLKISTKGYKPGDFTMIIGYPGRTNRYSPAAEIDYMQRVELPITNRLRKKQMEIIKKWMNEDPAIRMKYADIFFGLSNIQEMQEGQEQCFKRFNVLDKKKAIDKELQEWIDSDSARKEKWGDLLSTIQKDYDSIEEAEKSKIYFRETIFRGLIITRTFMRMNNTKGGLKGMCKFLKQGLEQTDPRVERELLRYACEEYFEHIDSLCLGPYQTELVKKFGKDYDAMTAFLWDNSFISSIEKAEDFCARKILENDPLWKFIHDTSTKDFYGEDTNFSTRVELFGLLSEYKRALYEMRLDKGIAQYPDANSTMRITYGQVSNLKPRDGIICSWCTSPRGLLEKYNPNDYDYALDTKMLELIKKGDWGKWGEKVGKNKYSLRVNFLTDNDITGGNSGSAVLNAKGELIGLAFDGNKESLASDCYYTPNYNKCVCVDIRYILWVLDKYAGMNYILDELGLN